YDNTLLTGIHYRDNGLSKGTLQYIDNSGSIIEESEMASKTYEVFEHSPKQKPSGKNYDPIPWPFQPFEQVHKVWNHYEQHMGDGSGSWSYLHQGLDIEVPINEPTYAVEEGWVKLMLTIGGAAYWRVAVSPEQVSGYSNGWLYAHLVESSIQVDVGDYVMVHDYLGNIIDWSGSWGHIHFVNIRDHGEVWLYDDDTWGINFNPLLALDPNTDEFVPVIENFSSASKFGFCINETSTYLDPDDLYGDIDIIAKISDYHGDSEWEQPAFKTYYWINKIPEDTNVFPKTLGQILNHTYDQYPSGYYEAYAPLMYKKDWLHPSPPWMNFDRDYWQILTNNNGDSIVDPSETALSFPTTNYYDGNYRIFVEAWDEYGNMTVDSQDVIFNNGFTNVDNNFTNAAEFSVFPNPAGSYVNIRFGLPGNSLGPVVIRLYDNQLNQLSELVKEDAAVFQSNSVNIDLSSCPTGLYFVEISQGNYRTMGKFIKL
ncbi:MAG: T9SS type A sorting domain-containing protein, partial [Bacteroidales bacterium]|nr:T9SS type A sorting domain-containing protein [Bacteroidales bacterium]